MEYIVVSVSALFVSAIALYSGFGLGTLLMPVFALFFPLPIAVASTAIVHMANNIFRVAFVGRSADWGIVLSFGLPAVLLAFPGAFLLVRMAEVDSLATYTLANREFSITAIKLIIAILILGFALFELVPAFQRVEVPRKFIPLGGALSGFFGGLSGHQGALRSAVPAKAGLEPGPFVGTVSVAAFMVDISRLSVYGATFFIKDFHQVAEGQALSLIITAILAALVGTYSSSKLLKQVTMDKIRLLVGVMLMVVGLALAIGLV